MIFVYNAFVNYILEKVSELSDEIDVEQAITDSMAENKNNQQTNNN